MACHDVVLLGGHTVVNGRVVDGLGDGAQFPYTRQQSGPRWGRVSLAGHLFGPWYCASRTGLPVATSALL